VKEAASSATKLTVTAPRTSASASSAVSRAMDKSAGGDEVTTGPDNTANTGSGSGNLYGIPHLTTNNEVEGLQNEINVNNSTVLKPQVVTHQRNPSLSGMHPVNRLNLSLANIYDLFYYIDICEIP
jgi:hypothetical protein